MIGIRAGKIDGGIDNVWCCGQEDGVQNEGVVITLREMINYRDRTAWRIVIVVTEEGRKGWGRYLHFAKRAINTAVSIGARFIARMCTRSVVLKSVWRQFRTACSRRISKSIKKSVRELRGSRCSAVNKYRVPRNGSSVVCSAKVLGPSRCQYEGVPRTRASALGRQQSATCNRRSAGRIIIIRSEPGLISIPST